MRLQELILQESTRQNLIAQSTADEFQQRHLDDSLQLLPLLPPGTLVDIGSGAGLPGLVVACCRTDPVHLVEPRAKRAQFLREAADALCLEHVSVWQMKAERVGGLFAAGITARAVAPLETLFGMAGHLADETTRWVLPKGRTARSELEAARRSWQGRFELIPSRTDDQAAIVVATGVRRRKP